MFFVFGSILFATKTGEVNLAGWQPVSLPIVIFQVLGAAAFACAFCLIWISFGSLNRPIQTWLEEYPNSTFQSAINIFCGRFPSLFTP